MQIRDAKAQANEIIAVSMKKAKAVSNETNVEDLVDKMTMGDILESEKPKKMKIVSPKIHAGGCTAVTFEQAGMLMATCGLDKTVRIWDTSSLKVQSTLRVSNYILLFLLVF
jgi:WD40 repeat protein